jgi:hypothetical protein
MSRATAPSTPQSGSSTRNKTHFPLLEYAPSVVRWVSSSVLYVDENTDNSLFKDVKTFLEFDRCSDARKA